MLHYQLILGQVLPKREFHVLPLGEHFRLRSLALTSLTRLHTSQTQTRPSYRSVIVGPWGVIWQGPVLSRGPPEARETQRAAFFTDCPPRSWDGGAWQSLPASAGCSGNHWCSPGVPNLTAIRRERWRQLVSPRRQQLQVGTLVETQDVCNTYVPTVVSIP